jgi:hypothetical protein
MYTAALMLLSLQMTELNAAHATSSTPTTAPDAADQIMIQALQADFGLDYQSALTQITNQRALADASTALNSALGASWSGSYVDHTNGGRLVVMTTDSAAATVARDQLPPSVAGLVDIKHTDATMGELQGLARQAADALKAANVTITDVSVDTPTNSVVATLPSAQALASQGISSANTQIARQALGTMNVVVRDNGGIVVDAGCMSTYQICDPPLRGGIEIKDTATGQICTAGFNVLVGTSRYSLTAGHCVLGDGGHDGDLFLTAFSNGVGHYIGNSSTTYPAGYSYGVDEALINVTNPTGWFPAGSPMNTVLVRASSGTRPTTENQLYPINSVGDAGSLPADMYLCTTGAATATGCGLYTGSSSDGFGMLNLRRCGGDSGRPVYAYNKGYGILHSVTTNGGLNTLHTFFLTYSAYCSLSTGTAFFRWLRPALDNFGAVLQ